MITANRNGRPRLPGDRFPSGKLKPQGANPRVVAMKRAVLGAKEGDKVDLSKAETPIDVAQVRGWLSENRHAAALHFIRLYSGIRFPAERTSRDPADFATEAVSPGRRLAELDPDDDVVLPMEWDLAEALEAADELVAAGEITTGAKGQMIAKANRRYLHTKMDWNGLPDAVVNRLFDATVMSARPTGSPGAVSAATSELRKIFGASATPLPYVPDELRELWASLKPTEARELFTVCVLGRWPSWLIQRVRGEVLESAPHRRHRKLLEAGLDKVIAYGKAQGAKPGPRQSAAA